MTDASPRYRKVRFGLAAAGLFLLHAALVEYFLPLRAVLRNVPLQGNDFDLHIGQVFRVVEGLRGWGQSWVYDVRLLAGQPEGTISDAGSKGWELWTYGATLLGASPALGFNTFVLLVMWAGPPTLFLAARLFGLSPWTSLLAAAMASCAWFFDSFAHWLWWIGMVSYSATAYLQLLPIALLYRYFETRRAWLLVVCAPLLGCILLIHPYSFFGLLPPMLALYLREVFGSGRKQPRLTLRNHLGVVSLAVVALAINAFWLRASLLHWHYILNSAFFGQADLRYLVTDFLNLLAAPVDTGVIGTRTGFRFLYFALCVAGCLVWRRQGDRRLLPLAVAMLSLLTLAYLGFAIPGAAQVQPYRHMMPAIFCAILPAAAFIEWLYRERVWAGLSYGARGLFAVAGFVCVQHLAIQVTYFVPKLIRDPIPFSDGTPSLMTKYGYFRINSPELPSHVHYELPHAPFLEPGIAEVIDWLEKHARPGQRVLTDSGLLGERIAWKTRLEVLGGFLERNVDHAYANFFRRYGTRMVSEPQVQKYMRTFAVDWIVLQGLRPDLERIPSLLRYMGTVGKHRIYQPTLAISKVLKGTGAVRATTNRIEVRKSDPSQAVVLAYHFHEALRCKPSCRVERQSAELDRVGFIRVPAPHQADFTVYNAYR